MPVGHKPRELSECTGCQAIICVCDDKYDAAQVALFPSLSLDSSHLLDHCEVLRLECSSEKIKSVQVKRDSEIKHLKAEKIILAAGVLNTTKILLNSKNEFWPFGLGNHSGLVGKNLCRHYMDLLMIDNKPSSQRKKYEKEIAINDFYIYGEEKLGTIQSLGNPPSFETVLYEMYSEFGRSGSWLNKIYYQTVKKFGRKIVNNLFQKKYCLATIMEDVSYQDNQVYINGSAELSIYYKIHPFEMKRISNFRELCNQSLRELKPELHKQAENNQRLAHASGTCRMGNDRRISVVDKHNRVHDVENLYIIDASFFPSSAGINPALTITANALRVAELLENKITIGYDSK